MAPKSAPLKLKWVWKEDLHEGVTRRGGMIHNVKIVWFTGFPPPFVPFELMVQKNFFGNGTANRTTHFKKLPTSYGTISKALEFAKKLAVGTAMLPGLTIETGDRIVVNQYPGSQGHSR